MIFGAARAARRQSIPVSPSADVERRAGAGSRAETQPWRRRWSRCLPIVLLTVDAMAGPIRSAGSSSGPGRILAAMLIGIAAAGLTSLGKSGGLAAAFFDGAGYGYTHVISLIVVASTFAAGVELSGLIRLLLNAMSAWPKSALVVAPVASWFLAFVAGTGIAPAVSIMEFFVPAAGSLGLDPIRLGAVTSLAAHFGRTMSPAAAVVMMAARLSGAGPRELIRRVALPLLIGLAVLIALAASPHRMRLTISRRPTCESIAHHAAARRSILRKRAVATGR